MSVESCLRERLGIEIVGGQEETDGSVLIVPDRTGQIGLLVARYLANKYMVDVVEKKSGARLPFNGWRIWRNSH